MHLHIAVVKMQKKSIPVVMACPGDAVTAELPRAPNLSSVQLLGTHTVLLMSSTLGLAMPGLASCRNGKVTWHTPAMYVKFSPDLTM